jgi:uncharacterized membrane protein YdjX (TVP38/TMEM64 family)
MKRIFFTVFAVLLLIFLVSRNLSSILPVLQRLLDWVHQQGVLAPALFILFYVVGTILFIPLIILTVSAGFLFGIFSGSFIAIAAEVLSAGLIFILARYFCRQWFCRKIEKNLHLQAVEEVIVNAGWKMVILTRISPFIPFHVLNYAYGVSRIPFWIFMLATFLAIIPGTFLYTALGETVGSLIGLQSHKPALAEMFLYGAGCLTSFAATYYITRLTHKTLKKKTGPAIH